MFRCCSIFGEVLCRLSLAVTVAGEFFGSDRDCTECGFLRHFCFLTERKTSSARLELFTFGISNGDPGLDEEGVCICYFESQRKTSSARLELFTFGISNGDHRKQVLSCFFLFFRHRDPGIWEYGGAVVSPIL